MTVTYPRAFLALFLALFNFAHATEASTSFYEAFFGLLSVGFLVIGVLLLVYRIGSGRPS
jgi:hypothetical protein